MTTATNHADFMDSLAAGPFAFPGGYPLFFVFEDTALSFASAWRERATIYRDMAHGSEAPVAGCNWEDPGLICDESGLLIESAYAEQNAAEVDRFSPEEWAAYTAWRARRKAAK